MAQSDTIVFTGHSVTSQTIPKLRMNPSCSPSVCPGPARLPKDLPGGSEGGVAVLRWQKITEAKGSEPVWETQKFGWSLEGMLWLKVKFVVECCIMWLFCPCRGAGIWRFLLRPWEVAVWDLGAVENDLGAIMGCSWMEQHLSPQEASSGPPVRAENLLSEECGNTEGLRNTRIWLMYSNHGMMQDDEIGNPDSQNCGLWFGLVMRKLGVPCKQYYFNLLYIYTVQTGSMYWESCFLIFFAWYVILPPFRHCHGVVADLDHCSNARLSDRPFWRCQVQGCVQIHRGSMRSWCSTALQTDSIALLSSSNWALQRFFCSQRPNWEIRCEEQQWLFGSHWHTSPTDCFTEVSTRIFGCGICTYTNWAGQQGCRWLHSFT